MHSNTSVVVVLDETVKVVYQKRLDNDLALILLQLAVFGEDIVGIAIESTFNWYWLVDDLMAAGYDVKLVNTTAVQTYSGLKYSENKDDARWLAHLLRLGILPTGYIYPKEERGVRDLLRKRSQLVRQCTTNISSAQNMLARNNATSMTSYHMKHLTDEHIEQLFGDTSITLALKANVNVIRCLQSTIGAIETTVLEQTRLRPEFKPLLSVVGIGEILGLTIMLESGDMRRFSKGGHFSSYCRCVKSERLSNNKKKGEGNRKSGNRYLAWAFIEAANFAVRYNDSVKAFYQKKRAKTNGIIATKAVANKLARACYRILKHQVSFDVKRSFGRYQEQS